MCEHASLKCFKTTYLHLGVMLINAKANLRGSLLNCPIFKIFFMFFFLNRYSSEKRKIQLQVHISADSNKEMHNYWWHDDALKGRFFGTAWQKMKMHRWTRLISEPQATVKSNSECRQTYLWHLLKAYTGTQIFTILNIHTSFVFWKNL